MRGSVLLITIVDDAARFGVPATFLKVSRWQQVSL